MLPEVTSIEPLLKQVLYGCVEHVQATKAALYLSASADLNTKLYELVTSYQYNVGDRKTISANDDLVDRLAVKRNAFYINSLTSDQRLAEILFRQGNERLLAAPLFSRGRLVGFIDMRDKAGKKPFTDADLEAARRIAEEVLGVLSTNQLYGLSAIPVVETSSEAPRPRTAPGTVPVPELPQVELRAGEVFSSSAIKALDAAREHMSRRQHAISTAEVKRALSEADLEVVRLLLPAALAVPGAVLACFTALEHANNPQSVVAIATVTEDAVEMLQSHLQAWLKQMNKETRTALQPVVIYPFGMQVVPVTAAGISTILSAPVNPQSVEGLVLTVAFERTPEAQAQRALHIFLRQIEQSVESAIAASSARSDRQLVAERLLEPDFQKFPELAGHCREVANAAQNFARVMNLAPSQVEVVRLAGLVHDVGMRLLDYERLYRRPALTAEQVRGLAEHPLISAALVEPLLGSEVAAAVLRHHERFDGRGYPSRLSGAQIPLSARILHICDAWVAMTSNNTYQATLSREEAMRRLNDGAGTQFDPQLVARFVSAIDEIV